MGQGGGLDLDAGGTGGNSLGDAACATAVEKAQVEILPVDIVWMVDNSASMAPAVAEVNQGINAFAQLIAAKNVDYKVIMLSRRGAMPVSVSGKTRYPICVPQPLSGDAMCGNGPRFFQSSVDMKSTQPLEQMLGTLGQTDGYLVGQDRGGEPWKQELRPNATKTFVIVTDDNSRLSTTDFETFAGGANPNNGNLTLPPGILDPSWNGLFTGYLFSGIYGWGSDVDPSVLCTYPDQSQPPSPGPTYTTLVQKTGGVRAKLCDGAAAWGPFFDSVAQAVVKTAKLSCSLDIPVPPMGMLDPNQVNVELHTMMGDTVLPRVDSAAKCGGAEAWYYDDAMNPKKVILCPAACDEAQKVVGVDKDGSIQVLFGCATIVK